MYSNGGEFIRTIGADNLNRPHGMAVSAGHYVFVTDYDSVSVFTTDGEYVTSFGQVYFDEPRGVCVDKDGFVYVCDNSKNRVQVF